MGQGERIAAEARTLGPVLELRDIVKTFPGVRANEGVSLTAKAGEVHALLGENGAGKTTLMNILYGLCKADAGEVIVRGRPVQISSPRDAINLGIGMVHQHFMLVRPHTVAENVALGLKNARFWRPDREVGDHLVELGQRYHLPVDPRARVYQLSAGEQQRVEILRALYREAEILILDEPTSVLTPQEAQQLFKVLRVMKAEGHAVIFITHKLDEVMQVADRVTVMRKGKAVDTLPTAETDKAALARLMVGRDVVFRLEKTTCQPGEEALVVEGLHARNDRGLPALVDVSLAVCKGEILGVAGVSGNGQRELVEVITGLRKADSGRVNLLGRELGRLAARNVADAGVAHVPEERLGMGVVPGMSVSDNLVLKKHHRRPFSRGPLLSTRTIRRHASAAIEEYRIDVPSPDRPAKLLSGGNIQKLILARELSGEPGLIVAAHPTYGLDVGATEQIRQLLLKQRERGAGILLVSEDLDEIIALSDRIAVLFNGRFMGVVPAAEADLAELGLMMAGEYMAGAP